MQRNSVTFPEQVQRIVHRFGSELPCPLHGIGPYVIDQQPAFLPQERPGTPRHLLADAPKPVEPQGRSLSFVGADDREVSAVREAVEGVDPLESGHPLGDSVLGHGLHVHRRNSH